MKLETKVHCIYEDDASLITSEINSVIKKQEKDGWWCESVSAPISIGVHAGSRVIITFKRVLQESENE